MSVNTLIASYYLFDSKVYSILLLMIILMSIYILDEGASFFHTETDIGVQDAL